MGKRAAADSPKEDSSSSQSRWKKFGTSDSDGSTEQIPVLELRLRGTTPLPALTLSPDLDDFLCVDWHCDGERLTTSDFLRDYLPGSRAVYVDCSGGFDDEEDQVQRRRESRVCELVKAMHYLNADKILRDTSSDNVFVWLLEQKRQVDSSPRGNGEPSRGGDSGTLIRSIEVDNVDTAIALYNAGHATYCRAPAEVEQNLVASFLKSTGLGCGQYDPTGVENPLCLGRGEVETFLSRQGHTTSWHFDFQHNFTIQLSGEKRWTLQQGTVLYPLRGCTPHYLETSATVEAQLKSHHLFDKRFVFGQPTVSKNAIGDPKTIVLRPGDTLFFPAGMWHKVETLSDSVSINVSLMATNYAHAVSQAFCHYLYSDPRFREPIINNSATNAVDHLRQLMKDLPHIASNFGKDDGSGAEHILPPILRYPPTFTKMDERSEDNNNDIDNDDEPGDEDEDDNENNSEIGGQNDNPRGNASEDPSDDSDVDDDDEKEEVIDPSEYVSYPKEWHFELEIGSTVQIFKNPLSALLKLDEITGYFAKSKDISRAREAFVLNVNFGGNELQSSAVRVTFLDNLENFTELLWHKERSLKLTLDPGIPLHTCTVTVNNHYLISFLVFHGYIQVKRV